ncbi:hypothetical protein V6N12_010890 [Hibiscus sabdariffa]|uniref:Disease resistance protein At4g27190-like leucine-rich repeats domain-containing protein n=1 Tax=Hibiscus sabdariffa TaxID=183260 RepID=A0ABR2ELF9_9ROSI
MCAVKRMDSGFYGDMESCFPSLEVLQIEGAGCLEEWTTMNGGEHFPLLRSLSIRGCCPKLVKLPMLQSLKELFVENANVTLLNSLMMNATNLTSLQLSQYVNGLQGLSSLSSLSVEFCGKLTSLLESVRSLTALQMLSIDGCPHLERRCKKERGEDWPIIAHIHSIRITSRNPPSFRRLNNLIREMNIKPTASLWGAILRASNIHGNMYIGEEAATHLFNMVSKDGGLLWLAF